MGGTKNPRSWEDVPLFTVPEGQTRLPPRRRKGAPAERLWTGNKALLIERYLYYFVLVTKHGTYIDGFAGPQDAERPESWAARVVLESEPKRLRHFHLCELDPCKVKMLRDLKREHENARRQVEVYAGDFNTCVHDILTAENIGPKEATFCLLDQRTFECHWATVQRLARFKKQGYRIELFYFLAAAWMDRALAAIQTEDGHRQVRLWWGGDGWEGLREVRGIDRARLVAARIVDELGYQSCEPYAIYQRTGGGRVMYYMLHATDHPETPMLMDRAYEQAVRPKEPLDQLALFLNLK